MTIFRKAVFVDSSSGLLTITGTSDTVSAEYLIPATNGESSAAIVAGAPVYISADGTVKLAKADDIATATVAALGFDASITHGQSGNIQANGHMTLTTSGWDAVTGDTGGLTPDAVYFLDAATAGKLTTTLPASPNAIVRVGLALSSTQMILVIQPPIAQG